MNINVDTVFANALGKIFDAALKFSGAAILNEIDSIRMVLTKAAEDEAKKLDAKPINLANNLAENEKAAA